MTAAVSEELHAMRTIPPFCFEPQPWVGGTWHATADSFAVAEPATGRTIATVEIGRAHV